MKFETEIVEGRLATIIRNGSGFIHLPDMREVYVSGRIIESLNAGIGTMLRCKVARNGGDREDARRTAELRCIWAVIIHPSDQEAHPEIASSIREHPIRYKEDKTARRDAVEVRTEDDDANAMAEKLRKLKDLMLQNDAPHLRHHLEAATPPDEGQGPQEKANSDVVETAPATHVAETDDNDPVGVSGEAVADGETTIRTMTRDEIISLVVQVIKSGGVWTSDAMQEHLIGIGWADDNDRLRIDSCFTACHQKGLVSHAAVYIDHTRARASRIYCAKDTRTLIGAFNSVLRSEEKSS